MSLAYFTIQYAPDPMRGEGRNVAVIGTTGGRGYLRAVGLNRDGQFDMAQFRAISGLSVAESVIYPEWIDYLQCVADENASSPEALARELGTLVSASSAFVPGASGEADIGQREGPEKAMDRVFERVVGQPPPETVDRFPDDLERFLRRSELGSRQDFWRDPEIELKTKTGITTLRFDFALVEAPAVGFRIVRYGADHAKTRRELRTVLADFELAWKAGFLSAGRSVLLTDRPWPAGLLLTQLARARVPLIAVGEDDAGERLHTVLRQRAKGRRA